MNIKVVAVYFMWAGLCYLLHSTFGGFGFTSGLLEGLVAVGLASIFWTSEDQTRRNR